MNATSRSGSASRPWEQPISFWEGFRIRWSGWIDRPRTRDVPDDKHTHFLHELQERAQAFQVKVLEWATAQDERLEMAIAAQSVIASQSIEGPSSTSASYPQQESMKGRAQWASERRAAARADAERILQEKRRQHAAEEIRRLQKQRDGLAEQRDIQFAQCARWFYQRAAKYNRARTGWFGLKVSGEPGIPTFVPVSFAGSRPVDMAEIGDVETVIVSSRTTRVDPDGSSRNHASGGSN